MKGLIWKIAIGTDQADKFVSDSKGEIFEIKTLIFEFRVSISFSFLFLQICRAEGVWMGRNPRRREHLHRSPAKSPQESFLRQDPISAPRSRNQREPAISKC